MISARDMLPGVPLIHSPFFDEIVAAEDWDAETRRVATALYRDGFAIIDFPDLELDALAEDIAREVFAPLPWGPWRAGEVDGLERVSDAWRYNESVRRIAVNAELAALLGRIYGREAFPFQTINFAIGSQQDIHVDVVHFSSAPENFMCGVWLALEDIEPGAGPLRYYPGSHRWPMFLNEHVGRPVPGLRHDEEYHRLETVWRKLRDVHGVEMVEFYPKKGQALIWAAGLHHGGAPHTDRTKTRHSQVTHFLFRDCAYWTPLLSDPFTGQIAFRRDFTDIRTGEPAANRVNGVPTPQAFMDLSCPPVWGGGQARPSLPRRALGKLRRLIGA
jgi:hypothetical protein